MSLPTIADSLAGRIEVHVLLPLSNAEIAGRPSDFLERALAQNWPSQTPVSTAEIGGSLFAHVLAGG